MSRPPFLIFPWHRPFLPELKKILDTLSRGRPQSALLIVPNKRPGRYFSQLYPNERVENLPQMITITELVDIWRGTAEQPLQTINELDRAALLYHCVQMHIEDDAALASRFAHKNLSDFLPWGLRLAALFEEFFAQRIETADIAHVEAEVNPTAAALLGAIARIRHSYLEALTERGWTTPGLDYAVACCRETVPAPLLPSTDRTILVAGFYVLTGTQDFLLHRLWDAGAHICLHSDPKIVTANISTKETGHWACEEHKKWLRRWHAQALHAIRMSDEPEHRTRFSFFAGYDCHSQLQAMYELLSDNHYTDSTAIVLTDSDLLMPVLHHLPDKNVNVSMGYPLGRSSLNSLLEMLFRLQATRMDDGRYYWRNLLQCLRHPYLKMLRVDATNSQTVFLSEALRHLEQELRKGNRFVDLAILTETSLQCLPQSLGTLLSNTLKIMVYDLAAVKTTGQMADWLSSVCHFLIACGGDMWRHFPLDTEAMYRLLHNVVPVLRETSLTGDFATSALHEITRLLLRRERIPFEAEPLTGLQVLGMLETRLLHFERVLIMDATDDKLPGNPHQDPLLPNSLRQALGLPDAHSREIATAYTLYRLCASASDVHFFWQEGINRSTFTDGKKTRSRFVEQLIWEEEQRRGALLVSGEPPLLTAACTIHNMPCKTKKLSRTHGMEAALHKLLRTPLSATLLDVYLHCPLRFAWQTLCNIVPQREINEGDDPAAVGTCIHETLRTLYVPYLGKEVRNGDISTQTLRVCFYNAIEQAALQCALPADSYLMLEIAAPLRLEQFLKMQPDSTKVVCLEERLTATLSLAGQNFSFKGIVDRLDMRAGLLYVLDYKTGTIKKHDATLWTDTIFFEKVATCCAGAAHPDPDRVEITNNLFEALRERLPSLQLPCYLAMLNKSDLGQPGDAAFVNLRDDGAEMPLFGELEEDERFRALGYCEQVLALMLTHMQTATEFAAYPDKHCAYCPYADLCNA